MVQRLDLPVIGTAEKPSAIDRELEIYERVRRALEDLGPTFVKFGQVMSLRPDMLPPPFIHELSKLQDEVRHEDFRAVKELIESGLGRSLKDLFTIFDPEPLAAASLSQVHRGVLRREGKIVAVKVQRPEIRDKIKTDLDIIAGVADRMHRRISEFEIYDLPNLVKSTRRSLLRELDFSREGHNMRIARAHQTQDPDIHIPEVYTDYCTEKILVMEFVQETRLKDLDIENLPEKQDLAKRSLRSVLKQILDDGFFHADPHPGNIVAALIIASSMIITTGVGPLLLGFPALGIIGYLISACVGLWLVFNIIRTRRY
jgi:ubiquinone biosynthesis protein